MTKAVDQPSPRLAEFAPMSELTALVARARIEDMGPRGDDVTSRLSVPESARGVAQMRSRAPGRLAGAALLPMIVRQYDPSLELGSPLRDSARLTSGAVVAEFRGSLRSILAMERVALNFVTHLSGIATLTARFVEAVAATRARIYDTRKTIPGLRGLAKYAVVCGGGYSHRLGLYDAVLLKDNHIAAIPLAQLAAHVADLVRRARAESPKPGFVEVEVDRLEQFERVLPARPDVVLLDNMPVATIRQAVAMRDREAPAVQLEASGGVTLDNVRALAETGVERIAIGAVTHSAPALDLGLDIA